MLAPDGCRTSAHNNNDCKLQSNDGRRALAEPILHKVMRGDEELTQHEQRAVKVLVSAAVQPLCSLLVELLVVTVARVALADQHQCRRQRLYGQNLEWECELEKKSDEKKLNNTEAG